MKKLMMLFTDCLAAAAAKNAASLWAGGNKRLKISGLLKSSLGISVINADM